MTAALARPMTVAEVLAKPVTMPWWPDAAPAFGYGRDGAYRAAKDGSAPVPILHLGRRLVVTRSALLAALGIEDAPPGRDPPTRDEAALTDAAPATTNPSDPHLNGAPDAISVRRHARSG